MKSKFLWLGVAVALSVFSVVVIFGRSIATILSFDRSVLSQAENPTPTLSATSAMWTRSLQERTTQDKFEEELKRLQNFRHAGTFEELLDAGSQIEKKWNGDRYGQLVLEFLSVLSSKRYANEVGEKCHELARIALAKADTFDLEIEWSLLLFLGVFDPRADSLSDSEISRRQAGTKLWLHAIRRLEITKDKNFNPENLPYLKVHPPVESGLPAGVAPEAIRDMKVRAEYERAIAENTKKIKYFNEQLAIRRQEKFFVQQGIDYIARAYSISPENESEMQKLLSEYKISEIVQTAIATRIASFKQEGRL